MKGITYSKSPFITAILAPQLERKEMPLQVVSDYQEFINTPADYSLLDGDQLLQHLPEEKARIKEILVRLKTNVALTIQKTYKTKVELLNLGVDYCIDIPVATEVVIKTIENTVKKISTTILRDETVKYGKSSPFSYLQNEQGAYFLTNGTRSAYLSIPEKLVLEYLNTRNGFASHGEIAYAGWNMFKVRRNTVTVVIKKLKRKMEELKLPYNIKNLYGYGYKLENY